QSRSRAARPSVSPPAAGRVRGGSAALAVTAVQAGGTAVHDHHGLGAALVAHRGAGREGDAAITGDLDVLVARGVTDTRLGEQLAAAVVTEHAAFRRRGRGRAYFSVFF